MARFNSYLTNAARAEIARALANVTDFKITRIVVGDGRLQSDFTIAASLAHTLTIPVQIKGATLEVGDEPYYRIVASLTNAGLTETSFIRELGVYIDTPTGEALGIYSVLDGDADTDNLLPPPASEGILANGVYDTVREENICVFFKDLPLDEDKIVVVVAPSDTLTYMNADGRYWRIGTQYPATENTETTGETTEEAQRRQDEEIAVMKEVQASGTTMSTTVELGAGRPLLWQINDGKGWHDAANVVYRAGGKIPPEDAEPEPEPETPGTSIGTGGKKVIGKR